MRRLCRLGFIVCALLSLASCVLVYNFYDDARLIEESIRRFNFGPDHPAALRLQADQRGLRNTSLVAAGFALGAAGFLAGVVLAGTRDH
jgi:hypothetical protein